MPAYLASNSYSFALPELATPGDTPRGAPPVPPQGGHSYSHLLPTLTKKKPTAPGVPRRSPIQVLTGPDVA